MSDCIWHEWREAITGPDHVMGGIMLVATPIVLIAMVAMGTLWALGWAVGTLTHAVGGPA